MDNPMISADATKLFDAIGGINPRLIMDEVFKFSVTEARNRCKRKIIQETKLAKLQGNAILVMIWHFKNWCNHCA